MTTSRFTGAKRVRLACADCHLMRVTCLRCKTCDALICARCQVPHFETHEDPYEPCPGCGRIACLCDEVIE